MSLPRLRFTLRRMMVAVAIAAGLIAIGRPALRLWEIGRARSRAAAWMALHESRSRGRAARLRQQMASEGMFSARPLDIGKLTGGILKEPDAYLFGEARFEANQAETFAKFRKAFERAAWRPWEKLDLPAGPRPPRGEMDAFEHLR